ncbi:Rtm1p-like protein [Fusarium bulbicola]|nr:Rtm1p-like protein [Fusarium bulbicola]
MADEYDFKLCRYTPSLAAAIISVVIFGILTGLRLWRLFRARAYYFTAFTIGGIFQVVEYAGRTWGHYDKESIAVPVQWVTRLFVTGDVVAFTLQAGGGGVQSGGTLDMSRIGEKMIVAGLFVQIAFFGFFICTSILFHYRYQLYQSHNAASLNVTTPWRRHFHVLYGSSLLILIRSIFRVVEYLQGNAGYLISHEIFLYIFDAILMAVVMLILVVWYVESLQPQLLKPDSEGGVFSPLNTVELEAQ